MFVYFSKTSLFNVKLLQWLEIFCSDTVASPTCYPGQSSQENELSRAWMELANIYSISEVSMGANTISAHLF